MEGACVILSALAETSTDWGSDIEDLAIYTFLIIHLLSIYYTFYFVYIPRLYCPRVLSPVNGFIYFFCDLIGYRYFQPLEPRMSDKR